MKSFLSPLFVFLFLISSCDTSAQNRVYYDAESLGSQMLMKLDTVACSFIVEARCSLVSDKVGRGDSRHSWGIAWNCEDMRNYDYVRLNSMNSDFDDYSDSGGIAVTYGFVRGGVDSVVERCVVKKDIGNVRGHKSLALEWRDGEMNVYFGVRQLAKVFSFVSGPPVSEMVRLVHSGELAVDYAVVETVPDYSRTLMTDWTPDSLAEKLRNSNDPMEGIWSFFDRTTDDNRARLGGRYSLACVSDGHTGYLLLYLDGAEVNASGWRPMMIKGRLTATQYENNYDLKWYDSMMEVMGREDFAVYDEEARLLTLQFPIHRSKIRFAKRPVSGYRF